MFATVVSMVLLGIWQLRRLEAVRNANDRARARLALPVQQFESVLTQGDGEFRRIEVHGTYDSAEQLIVENRSHRGNSGVHVLTPLRTTDGRYLLVDRGWIPLDVSPDRTDIAAPREPVRVVGVLFPSERKGTFGASFPPRGRLTKVPRVEVSRISEQLPAPAHTFYLRLESQAPRQAGEFPAPAGLPALDEGPHLAYAVQWFIFATIAAATYAALCLKTARAHNASGAGF